MNKLQELKAQAYDLLANIQMLQNQLQQVNSQIQQELVVSGVSASPQASEPAGEKDTEEANAEGTGQNP